LAGAAVIGLVASLVVTGTDATPDSQDPAAAGSTIVEAPDAPPAKPRPKFDITASPKRAITTKADAPEVKGFDPRTSVRVDAATSETGELYRNVDGSVSQVVSAAPVRFRDEHQVWRPIDPTVVDEPDGRLHARSVPVRTKLTLDELVPTVELPVASGVIRMREVDHGVLTGRSSKRGRGPDRSAGAEGLAKGAQVRFAAAGDRQLNYRFLASGVKEDVILESRQSGSSFEVSFGLPAGVRARQGKNQIDFVGADGKTVAVYGGGLAADAVAVAANAEVGPAGTTTQVEIDLLRGSGATATVRVGVDRSWFQAPNRAFPVWIDPIFQQAFAPGNSDVYLNADNPDGTAPGGGPEVGIPYVDQTHLRVGNRTGAGHAITFLPFNTLAAPSGYTYSSAYLQLYGYDGSTCAATATVRSITSSWNPSTVTWNTQPSLSGAPDGSQSLVQTLGAWQTFGVSSAVGSKFAGQPWYGLAVVSDDNASQCGWREFYSSNAGTNPPVLVATFTAPDPPPPPPPPPAPPASGPASFGTSASQPKLEDPVNVVTGNLTETFTDLPAAEGVYGLAWGRTYNLFDASTTSGLGRGWSSPFTATVGAVTGGVELVAPDGRRAVWTPAGSGYNRPFEFPADLSVAAGNYRLTFNDGSIWDFDTQGRIASLTSPVGDVLTVNRDSNGQLTTVASSQGQQLSFTYGTGGRIASVTGPAGTVSYGYDTNGNQTSFTNTAGKTTSYGYDTANRLTTITDPTGVVLITNTFDSQSRVATQAHASGATTTFVYGAYDSATGWWTTEVTDSVTGAAGKLTYYYDAALRVRRVHDNLPNGTGGNGNDASRDYGTALGDLTAIVSRAGGQQSYVYDSANRMTCAAEPAGVCPGSGAGLTAGSGRYRAWHYDSAGRVDQVFVAGQGLSTYTYSGSSRIPASATDANGKVTAFTISNSRVSQETDPDGVTTTYTYTSNGQIESTTDGAGNTTAFAYDTAGRLRCTAQPGGSCPDTSGTGGSGRYSTTTYTADGWIASERAADGAITSYTYDEAGRILTVTDPTGFTIVNHYNATTGLLLSVDKPGAVVSGVIQVNTWHYTYDQNGNRTCEAAPGGTCPNAAGQGGVQPYTLTAYGPLGRVLSETNELGQTTSYVYDGAGNRTEVHAPDGGITRTVYDAAGREVQTIDPAGRITATYYDSAGRVSCLAKPGGNCQASSGPIETTTYDAVGRVATFTDATGAVTTYTYTDAGRTATVNNPATGPTTTVYDAAGRAWKTVNAVNAVTTLAYNAFSQVASRTSPTGLVTSMTYDAAGRELTNTDPAGVATVRTYSLRGELLTEKKGTQGAVTYTYNPDSTLAAVTDPLANTTTYTYDTRGNRLTRTNAAGKTETWTYDSSNQPLTHADQLNRQTIHTYWNNPTDGRKEAIADPSGRTTTTRLGTDSAISTRMYQQGTTTLTYTYGYDTVGHLASVSDGTKVWNTTYNPAGQLTSTTYDPVAHYVTNYSQTAAGQRAGTDDTTYTYDILGNLKTVSATTIAGSQGGFLAGAEGGKLGTSPDGLAWTQRTSGFGADAVYGSAYSPQLNLFVAVGGSGKVATSPDGVTWTMRSAGFTTSDFVWSVVWSPERSLFVAVSQVAGGRIATSPDGVTWTQRTPGLTVKQFPTGVIWVPERALFVIATASSGTTSSPVFLTSPDGITWTARSSSFPVDTWVSSIGWSPTVGRFVSFGWGNQSGIPRFATSTDGISWSQAASPGGLTQAVTWSPALGRFLAVGTAVNGVMTSSDGLSWTVQSSGISNPNYTTAIWNPTLGLFFIAGSNGATSSSLLATSPDGVTWTQRTSGFGNTRINTLSQSPQVATQTGVVATYSYDAEGRVLSEVGPQASKTYTYGTSGTAAGRLVSYTQAVAGANVATTYTYDTTGRVASETTNGLLTSYTYDQGGQLLTVTPSTGTPPLAYAYDNVGRLRTSTTSTTGAVGAFFLAGAEGGKLGTSPDGLAWTQRTSGFGADAVYGSAYSPQLNLFVAVGGSGKVATSPDGVTWTMRSAGFTTSDFVWSVVWSPERSLFVAVSQVAGGRIATSPDGVTWTQRTPGLTVKQFPTGVIWVPERALFVIATASSGTTSSPVFLTSPDGITWTARSSSFPVDTWVSSIGWSPTVGRFVSFGWGNQSGIPRFATSTDGISWSQAASPGGLTQAVTWSPALGRFLAVGTAVNGVMTSSDGLSWTVQSSGISNPNYTTAIWNPTLGLFFIAGSNGATSSSLLATSPDGVTWTQRTSGFGNTRINTLTVNPGTNTPQPMVTTYSYDDAGELCWSLTATAASSNACGAPPGGSVTYTYDPVGRRLTEAGVEQVTYSYSATGQMASLQRSASTGTSTQVRTYDPDGYLASVANNGGGATAIAWDKSLSVPVLRRVSGTTLIRGADDWIGQATSLSFNLIASDAYGSVIATPATASLARASQYDSWGNAAGAKSLEPRLGYRGELTIDSLTNLRAREYQPATSQFLSVDPLDGVDGTTTVGHGYAYANNDPLNLTDPEGLQAGDAAFDRPEVRGADLGLPVVEPPVLPPLPVVPPGPIADPATAVGVAVALAAGLTIYAGASVRSLQARQNKLAEYRDLLYKAKDDHYRGFPLAKPGSIIYRVHNSGLPANARGRFPKVRAWPNGSAAWFGKSWSPIPPQVLGTRQYWDFAGLPWQNYGNFLTVGRLRYVPPGFNVLNARRITVPSLGYDAHGGLLEWEVPGAAAAVQQVDTQFVAPGYGYLDCCYHR
jgi:RHS repeat-associated protein